MSSVTPTAKQPPSQLKRIRSGAADHKEDGVEALAKLGIKVATK